MEKSDTQDVDCSYKYGLSDPDGINTVDGSLNSDEVGLSFLSTQDRLKMKRGFFLHGHRGNHEAVLRG